MNSKPVIDAVLCGIENAQRNYENWSGGDYLHGAEYIATYCIAQAIQKVDSVKYFTVEQNARSAIVDAGGTLREIGSKTISFGSRFDLAVWNSTKVKGLVAYFTSMRKGSQKSAEKRIEDRTHQVFLKARKHVTRKTKQGLSINRHCGRIHVDGDSAWTAEVLEISNYR